MLRASFTDKTKAFSYLLKSDANTEAGRNRKMGDLWSIFNSLNPLKCFTKNCKTYRTPAKPVSISKLTSVRFSSSVKFINNIFDNFNNIYYFFLLSGAAIESHPGKQLNKK